MHRSLVYFFVLSIAGWACDSKTEQKAASQSEEVARVVIYGSSNCSHCMDFKSELDEEGVVYIFNDVEFSDELTLEMLQVVKTANITGQINYPVVVVDNAHVMIRPEMDVVLDKLK